MFLVSSVLHATSSVRFVHLRIFVGLQGLLAYSGQATLTAQAPAYFQINSRPHRCLHE